MTDTSSAGVYSARDNTEAQFTELERRMAGDGWVRPQLLEYMRTAPDFYFDEMAQIIMDRWSQGRIALVGDAGYCCSPLSGQGTSVALLGAYILTAELAEADGDHALGFANYFTAFGDYVLGNQWLASDDAPGGEPNPPEERYRVIHSITPKDYSGDRGR